MTNLLKRIGANENVSHTSYQIIDAESMSSEAFLIELFRLKCGNHAKTLNQIVNNDCFRHKIKYLDFKDAANNLAIDLYLKHLGQFYKMN